MKKNIFTLGLAVFAACALNAQEKEFEFRQVINCETKNQMRTANSPHMKYLTLVDGGVSGKCYRLVCPKELKSLLVHPQVFPFIPIKDSSLPITCTIHVKGKARGNYGLICYSEKRKCIYPREGGPGKKFEINSPDKWVKLSFTYTPRPGRDFATKVKFVQACISIASGGELYFDELIQEIEKKDTGIKIVD